MIEIERGEDRDINIFYRDERNRPLDLTDCTVEFTVSPVGDPETITFSKSTSTYKDEEGASQPLDETGKATLTITNLDSELMDAGTYKCDAEVTDADDVVTISKSRDFVVVDRRS